MCNAARSCYESPGSADSCASAYCSSTTEAYELDMDRMLFIAEEDLIPLAILIYAPENEHFTGNAYSLLYMYVTDI